VHDLGLRGQKPASEDATPELAIEEDVDGQTIVYIDLSAMRLMADKNFNSFFARALDHMVSLGLSMLANHPTVRLTHPKYSTESPTTEIEWKCEGSTRQVMSSMAPNKSTGKQRLHTMMQKTLIWSGGWKKECDDGRRQVPFYLARGIIGLSPRELLHLLWDDTRTGEYNNYCLGRSTILTANDDNDEVLKSGRSTGTKVIRSEMKVPFTSMTVALSCMMHLQPLEGVDEGYVIVSRSLDSGRAGTHFDGAPSPVDAGSKKSEILWGINVIRSVPRHPHLVDLTSLSQVESSMVPNFVARKIGIRGIENFFRNVRALKPQKQ
jgi:hypothetical protein